MEQQFYCYNCFESVVAPGIQCPKCGFTARAAGERCLPLGTVLNDRYIVGVHLGIGGFGITYKCLDTRLGIICAIKEYFPENYAIRYEGTTYVVPTDGGSGIFGRIMTSFLKEATLVMGFDHPNVINVYDGFSQNNTAYYVMEYCEGTDLIRYTNNFSRTLGVDETQEILLQLLDALNYVHRTGVLHRDISPDNIFISGTRVVKLLDFGASRYEMDQMSKGLTQFIKGGYTPLEQQTTGTAEGWYTDIYAVGATFYQLLTGIMPDNAVERMSGDGLVPLSQYRPDLPDGIKYFIESALSLRPQDRLQKLGSIDNIKRLLLWKPGEAFPVAPSASAGAVVQSNASPAQKKSLWERIVGFFTGS